MGAEMARYKPSIDIKASTAAGANIDLDGLILENGILGGRRWTRSSRRKGYPCGYQGCHGDLGRAELKSLAHFPLLEFR